MTQEQAYKIWQLSLAMADTEREYQKVVQSFGNNGQLEAAHIIRVNATIALADYIKSCIE